ncbi:MAG: IPT/TIG domain-containing protein [Pseudomonadota bacterium]
MRAALRNSILPVLSTMALVASSVPARAQVPESVGFVESSQRPLRVYYNTQDNAALAQHMLDAAEAAWTAEIDGMGFAVPVTVDDQGAPVPGMRIYLVRDSNIAGHVVALGDIPGTPRTDCAAITLVSDSMPSWYLPNLLAHEFNHACQFAVECTDSNFAFEQITVAVTTTLYPEDSFLDTVFADFQREPERPLFYVDWGSYYHYGASLFSYFLDQTYGAGDGRLLARIWDATAQPGEVLFDRDGLPYTTAPNEPDLIDAMTTVLAEEAVVFADAFTRFSEARYFIGRNDDGKHIRGAAQWRGAEVAIDTDLALDQLPLSKLAPHRAPQILGTSFLSLDLAGAPAQHVLRVRFDGDPQMQWRPQLLTLGHPPNQALPVDVDAQGHGQVLIEDVDLLQRVVVAVANLGSEEPDPESFRVQGGEFTLDLAMLNCAEPSLSSSSPSTLTPGQDTTLTIQGQGFWSDQEMVLALSGTGARVVDVERLSDTELRATIRVDAGATPGARDLSLGLECGAQTTSLDVLEVVPEAGCQCHQATRTTPATLVLGLLMLGVLRRRHETILQRRA